MKYTSYSDCGGRENNEDSIEVISSDKFICAVLADGLGGHGGGATASRIAVDTIVDELQNWIPESITEEAIQEWCHKANQNILDKQTADCRMKTTIVALFYEKDTGTVLMAHVGDSRAYHFVDGKNRFCTFDHSVSRMAVVSGEISMDEIRHHVDRNKLLRSVGGSDNVRVEIDKINLQPGEKNDFLLCSDGFWEYVMEEEMEQTLLKYPEPENWLAAMRKILKQKAPKENDNNSAIVVEIEEE